MSKRPNILKLATKISLESLTYTGISYNDPEYRILAPIVDDDMCDVMMHMRLEANLEYRFNIFWKIAGAVFADAGNVWTLQGADSEENQLARFRWDTFGESIAANWGTGIRLDFGFLLLRLDLGLRVHDPARENKWVRPNQWFKRDGYALHFGVGYPF